MIKRILLGVTAGLALALALPQPAAAQHLRIGLREDPDILDPTLARTFVGRIVFAALCDKLFDIDARLQVVPQLAESYRWEDNRTLRIVLRPGLRFHDGEVLDAEAVRYSLLRHLNMQGSFRRAEISTMEAVEVVDARTVLIRLRSPSAPFVSQLTDRAGMIVSPRAAEAAGRNFGLRPVCAGPYRFVERVAQDRIVVERFPEYWNAQNIHIQRITYLPIPDSTVRLANLQSGALEMVQTIDPDDIPAVRRNNRLRLSISDELGWQSIQFNIGNGPRSQTPLGQDPRVREAFELAIDRAAINQVVYEGVFAPTAQPFPPASPFHLREVAVPSRNVERARALLREAGVRTPLQVELTVPNNPDLRQVGEVIQAMVREAGFDLRINAMEFASALQAATRGEFEAFLVGWSGRVDPDGNVYTFLHSRATGNDGRYSHPEVDRLLDAARAELDPEKRRELYLQIVQQAVLRDRARIFLWHRKNIVAHTARLSGFVAVPDGLIRPTGLRLN
ncbi:MAG: ABC transporter substrate-binding protein [Rhodovarius sp.]|nr:ABC transporter substrate-binding protein [Rhodovarius sp.]MDW8316197.1 ABC transporter substrate-binding protein [Rhodovarius sp.]